MVIMDLSMLFFKDETAVLSPTIASIIVSYRILFRHKRTLNGDDLLFRHFIWGMRLMGFGFATALAVAITGKLERFFH
jgi:hypothetical protein